MSNCPNFAIAAYSASKLGLQYEKMMIYMLVAHGDLGSICMNIRVRAVAAYRRSGMNELGVIRAIPPYLYKSDPTI